MRITSSPAQDMVIRSSICTFDAPLTPMPMPMPMPMLTAAPTAATTHTATTTTHTAATTYTATQPTTRAKKHVRWGTVTALEFGVGHNACCVPGSAGPPVGLVGGPIRYTVSSVQSEASLALAASRAVGSSSSKARRQDFWLCPMERVKILHDEAGLSLEAITEICSGVSAVLDARSVSKFDHVAHHILETLELNRTEDLRKLRATYHQDNRKKIVLF